MNGILPTSNQQKCFNPKHPGLSELDPTKLKTVLREHGCDGCELVKLCRYPVVYRGNAAANKMIIGEAPGRDEDIKGKPFTGPAGIKLDQIFASVGWDTNKDWYLTNVVKCRPKAQDGIKQNFTPTAIHRDACRPYILQEITYLKPHTIVLLGKSAVASVLPKLGHESMASIAGKLYHDEVWPGVTFFVMYHPAALLHMEGHSPDGFQALRQAMWKHINTLKEFVLDLEQ